MMAIYNIKSQMFSGQRKQEQISPSFFIHFPMDQQSLNLRIEQEKPEKKASNRGRPKGEKKQTSKKQPTKKQEKTNENIKTGHWSHEQNKKYHLFLQVYNNHFLNKHMRRTDKIFKIMQSFIGSREAEQCRSHHQKMQKKYKTFQTILIKLRQRHYGNESHCEVVQDLRKNNIEIIDTIMKSEELYNIPEAKIEESEQHYEIALQLKQESKAIDNIFSDRYENNMEFNNFG